MLFKSYKFQRIFYQCCENKPEGCMCGKNLSQCISDLSHANWILSVHHQQRCFSFFFLLLNVKRCVRNGEKKLIHDISRPVF